MQKKPTLQELKDELASKKPTELYSIVKNLNSYGNVHSFARDGISVEELLKFGVAQLLKRKMRIPGRGYFDLIDMVDKARDKKKG